MNSETTLTSCSDESANEAASSAVCCTTALVCSLDLDSVCAPVARRAANEGALDAAAATYANFCERAATAAQSLGLAGLSSASSSIGEGLTMASSLPLEMRVPAAPLLKLWPDFFMAYMDAWSKGQIPEGQQAPVGTLLANMLQAEFVTPLDEAQFAELQALLLNPPLVADQQAALLPAFELPGAVALSLDSAADAEMEVLDGFLSEGPQDSMPGRERVKPT